MHRPQYRFPAGISNYGNSESAPFIISSGNSVNPSPFSHTLRSEPSGIRNPEFDCSLSGASIQVLHDVLGIRNPESGLSLLHRPRKRPESGIRNLKSLVQPETKARGGHSGTRNPEFRLVEPKTGALVGTADVLAAAQMRPMRDLAIAVARDRYHRRRPPCCTSAARASACTSAATRAIDSSSPEADLPRRRPRGADR